MSAISNPLSFQPLQSTRSEGAARSATPLLHPKPICVRLARSIRRNSTSYTRLRACRGEGLLARGLKVLGTTTARLTLISVIPVTLIEGALIQLVTEDPACR